jgi:hypothetical protein
MKRWVFSLGLLLPFPAYAADFYLHFDTCKSVVGYLVVSEHSLKVVQGDPLVMRCRRSGSEVQCQFEHADPSRGPWGKRVSYGVIVDSPPSLIFGDAGGADDVRVNTRTHAATLVSRISDPQFTGSKVCTGIYFTDRDLQDEPQKAPRPRR